MSEKQVRKKFSNEFKQEAVALVTEQGYSFAKASDALSIHESYLRRWKKVTDEQNQPGGLLQSECDELARLRRENTRLKMEKEILKKASAFFAREMN